MEKVALFGLAFVIYGMAMSYTFHKINKENKRLEKQMNIARSKSSNR